MQIAGKLKDLLQRSNIVRFQDLDQQFQEKQIRQGFINFGVAHPTQLVCSFVGRNNDTKAIVTGTLIMKAIIELYKSTNVTLQKIHPLVVFNEDVELQAVLKQRHGNLFKKQGVIMPRKLRTRLPQNKQVKSQLGKKNKTQAADLSQTQQKNKKKQQIKTKSMKQQIKFQNKNEKKQEIKREEEQKKQQVNLKPQKETKASLKVVSQSDSEQRVLRQYSIEAPSKMQKMMSESDITKQPPKQEKQQKQLQKKVQQIDQDGEDAFELLLQKKNKQKANEKIENKNTNIPNAKVEKKTTEKAEGQPKPKQTAVQTSLVRPGQPNLLSFFNKKMG